MIVPHYRLKERVADRTDTIDLDSKDVVVLILRSDDMKSIHTCLDDSHFGKTFHEYRETWKDCRSQMSRLDVKNPDVREPTGRKFVLVGPGNSDDDDVLYDLNTFEPFIVKEIE